MILDERNNKLINFGRAGLSGAPLPKNAKVLSYGTGTQSARIQAALDGLKNGEVLSLASGVWLLDKPLFIRKSGTGIIGSGATLKAMWARQDTILTVCGPGWINNRGRPVPITQDYTVGDRKLKVAGFNAGDNVIVQWKANDEYIRALKMDTLGWKAKDYVLNLDRTVKSATATEITLDDDLVIEVRRIWGSAAVFKYTDARIENIVISGLAFDSVFKNAQDEAHAKIAISLEKCRNVLVSSVSTKTVQTAVFVDHSVRYAHVLNCRSERPISQVLPMRRYTFYINGVNCLVEGCHADSARHAYVTGAEALGPSVFYNSGATNELNDSGPHQRHACGFLYDNMNAYIRVQNRGDSGSGQGWAGLWHVLWNTALDKQVAVQSLKGVFVNYGAGISAIDAKYLDDGVGDRDFSTKDRGKMTSPKSLFESQKKN